MIKYSDITNEFLFSLTENKLKKLIKKTSQTRKKKYKRNKNTKYGNLCRAMKLEDLNKFFSAIKPEEYRFKVLFLIQCFLGLRIGEAVKIQLNDLNFQEKWIKIHTEKKRFNAIDFMAMHEKLQYLLLDYINIYEKDIQKHQNYLFWSQSGYCKTPHFSPSFARTIFRRICNRAGLTQTYGKREAITQKLKPENQGNLYLYSTHSLRHAFCQYLRMHKIPIEIAKTLMRHESIKSTEVYYKATQKEANQALEQIFNYNHKPLND